MPFCDLKVITLLLTLNLLAGCAELNTRPPEPAPKANEPMPVKLEIDPFLEFGANMAAMSPAARDESCLTLVKSQKSGNTSSEIVLRLLIGRLLSESCGDSRKILDSVTKITVTDARLRQMILLDTEALKRNMTTMKKISTERKTKSSTAEAKANKETTENETRLLREKLEAIRSLERHLDASGD